MRLTAVAVAVLCLLLPVVLRQAPAGEPQYQQRWFYACHNLLVDKSVDEVVRLIERAGRSGYNGVVLADYKFNILDRMPRNYFQNVERVRKAAEAQHMEIIPAIFPIGYSDGLLAHDPNLAEGLEVKDAPFVVRGRDAVLVPDRATRLVNGDLEQVRGDQFLGFSFQDEPGTISFADRIVVHHGKLSCRMQDVNKGQTGNCRLVQRVKVRPHGCYRFSCWVKTQAFQAAGSFHLLALGTSAPERSLTFHEGHFEPTQDWTQVEVVFNTLDEREVSLYAGIWGGQSGKLWVDQLALEQLGLINVLRRPGCPLRVRSADGLTVYDEGKDFEPVHDALLGQVPYAGLYSFRHSAPSIRLTANSRVRNGQRLRVSWYHPVQTHGEQMMCCLTEPAVYDLLRDQARRVNELLHPRTFFFSHDEIRVANWCQACQATGKTPGELLADNVRRCTEIIKEFSPQARVVVWSDMFDPYHNAVDHYYLVHGTLKGSWKGLQPEVVIANWNSGKAAQSLRWFADQKHQQVIAGYYDTDLALLR
jgi:hypothetical protein